MLTWHALRAGFLKHEAALRPLLDEIWPVLCGAVSYGKVSVATISGAAQVLCWGWPPVTQACCSLIPAHDASMLLRCSLTPAALS